MQLQIPFIYMQEITLLHRALSKVTETHVTSTSVLSQKSK